ncbi:hypothetical protein [Pantoea sp. RSPAM1]|uniref:hypothetical protein n=1 Tax=Pantoea sp. RSPAM1 TaxID=2675223 RepID=UPI00315CD98E
MTLPDHARMVDMLLCLKGMCVLSGYAHEVYLPLESAGWKRIEIDVSARSSQSRTRRTECLWVSPSSVKGPLQRVAPTGDLTNRQAAAYRVHELRTSDSEQRIREAVSVLRRTGNKITKAEVARITGISRVQISRRYSHLFDEK